MIDVLVQGRLFGDPVRRTAKNGRDFATARLVVTDASGEQHLAGLIAFNDDVVRQLLALADGDSVAVAGELSIGTYATKSGEVKPALRLLVHAILTPYHVKRRREAATGRHDEGTHTARTPADRQRRHAAAMRFQRPLPDDGMEVF